MPVRPAVPALDERHSLALHVGPMRARWRRHSRKGNQAGRRKRAASAKRRRSQLHRGSLEPKLVHGLADRLTSSVRDIQAVIRETLA